MIKAPCKDCPNRDYPRCHRECAAYQEFKAARAKAKQAKRDYERAARDYLEVRRGKL